MEFYQAHELMKRKRRVVLARADGQPLDAGRIVDVVDYGKGQGELCLEREHGRQWFPVHFVDAQLF